MNFTEIMPKISCNIKKQTNNVVIYPVTILFVAVCVFSTNTHTTYTHTNTKHAPFIFLSFFFVNILAVPHATYITPYTSMWDKIVMSGSTGATEHNIQSPIPYIFRATIAAGAIQYISSFNIFHVSCTINIYYFFCYEQHENM